MKMKLIAFALAFASTVCFAADKPAVNIGSGELYRVNLTNGKGYYNGELICSQSVDFLKGVMDKANIGLYVREIPARCMCHDKSCPHRESDAIFCCAEEDTLNVHKVLMFYNALKKDSLFIPYSALKEDSRLTEDKKIIAQKLLTQTFC